MKMNQEDLRLLSAAVREAGEDLFCVTGALPTYETLADAFVSRDENTLLLLPGPFSLPDSFGAVPPAEPFEAQARFGYSVFRLADGVLAADVRMLTDQGFRAYCGDRRVSHLLIPFAELSDEIEYGYRSAYGWIAELRAELPFPLRVTALFSIPQADYSRQISLFGCSGCTVVDASLPLSYYSFEMADVRSKYAYTLELAQRRVTRRTAVLFTDRREAEEFRRYCGKCGVRTLYINGATDKPDRKRALELFEKGEGILVATKSVLPSAVFYRADEVIFCGVPYSRAFMSRCASLSSDGTLNCCYCRQDFRTDTNILKHFAELKPDDLKERYFADAAARLTEVKKLICDAD